jgi:hypothetical protein
MYELRNLRHGHRPVTGQDNRRNVEEFFNQALQEESVGREPPTQTHRPEAVLVEVNALVERRPVSSALRRSGFISRLEGMLQGAMSRIPVTSTRRNQSRQTSPSTSCRCSWLYPKMSFFIACSHCLFCSWCGSSPFSSSSPCWARISYPATSPWDRIEGAGLGAEPRYDPECPRGDEHVGDYGTVSPRQSRYGHLRVTSATACDIDAWIRGYEESLRIHSRSKPDPKFSNS